MPVGNTARVDDRQCIVGRCPNMVLEIARAANSPVFGPSAKGFESVR